MATIPKMIEAYKTDPVHALTNKNLDSFEQIPDSHDWVQPNSFPSFTDQSNISDLSSDTDSVPLIDLSLPNAPKLIGNALRTWGVFQAINHGVPISVLNSMESLLNDLFDLPTPQKLKAARSRDGVNGYGRFRISTFFPKSMWSEGFTVSGSPLEHFQILWPHDCTKYCDIIEEYDREMKGLCGRVVWLALGELGITREDVNWAGPNGDFPTSSGVMNLNSYPVCPDPDRAMGIGVHTDSCFLTLLYQNNASGLQVLREGKRWVTVDPVPGALVVQVADLLQILTNGLYSSPFHQAVVNRDRKRLSVAYFFGPPVHAEISPIKKLVNPTQPLLYPTVTWAEYLCKKAELFNDTLPSIRLSTPPTESSDVNDHSQVKIKEKIQIFPILANCININVTKAN